MRAVAGGRLEHAGAQPLAAHFHQAEARNATDLNPRAVALERFLHRALDLPRVGIVFHVDEVDHHQPGHVTQAQLAGDFARRLEIGVERGLLDPVFLGRAARVDVDRDQRLGRVDHQVTARFELHHWIVHRLELVFRAVALEQRHRVGIGLHPARMARHQQFHELLGRLVAFFALDHDFLDVAVVDVADRALDQVAVRMDQRRRAGGQRLLANLVPQPREIVEIALDLGLGAAEPGGADDQAHRARELEVGDDLLEPLAVLRAGNLAADAAAMAAVGHQHRVAPGEAEIGRQRGALVAAFFLDHLHQQHLAALDDVLDLVAAAQGLALGAHFVDFLGARLAALALAAATLAATAPLAALVVGGFFFVVGFFVLGIVLVILSVAILDTAFLDRGDLVLVRSVDFLDPVLGDFLDQRFGGFLVLGVVFVAGEVALFLFLGAKARLFLGRFGFLGEQPFAVCLRNLIVVGVDFAEGEEAVPVAAEIDERRLQAGFYSGYLGEVDVTLDLLVFGRFEIEFLNPVSLEHRHPRFFRVARIDKHARCHCEFSRRCRAGRTLPGTSADSGGSRRSHLPGRRSLTGWRSYGRHAGVMCLQECDRAVEALSGPRAQRHGLAARSAGAGKTISFVHQPVVSSRAGKVRLSLEINRFALPSGRWAGRAFGPLSDGAALAPWVSLRNHIAHGSYIALTHWRDVDPGTDLVDFSRSAGAAGRAFRIRTDHPGAASRARLRGQAVAARNW